MKKAARWIIYGIVGLLLLGVVGYLGLELFLNSAAARRMASSQISAKLGSVVHITELDTTGGSTTVKIEVMTTPTTAPENAPATALASGTVKLDVSPVALATGTEPQKVTIEQGHVTLHFDATGKITDRLPKPKPGGNSDTRIPDILIKGASAHLIQEGKPDFRVSGIDITIKDQGDHLIIQGVGKDPSWGSWTLGGQWSGDGETGTLTLKTDEQVLVDPPKLQSLPFVPNETWEWVQIEGTTPCSVQIGKKGDDWTWHVELEPKAKRLTVPPIELTLTDGGGKVIVDGPKVTLTGVQGHLGAGNVNINSVLDFGPTPSKLSFDVKGEGVDIRHLPKSWKLPPEFTGGKLQGSADLTLLVDGGKVIPQGKGRVVLKEAEVLGFPAEVASMRIVGDGQRFRWVSESEKSSQKPIVPGWVPLLMMMLQPAPPAPTAPPPPVPPATTTAPKTDEPSYVQARLRLRDVDITEFLKRAKVTSPVQLAGKVTIDIAAEIPLNDSGTFRSYRGRGKITVPELKVEGLTALDVSAEIDLRNGVINLSKLSALVPDPSDPQAESGKLTGTARYGYEPRTDLTAELNIAGLPMAAVLAAVPDLKGQAAGRIDGRFSVTAPGDRISEIESLRGDGLLTSQSLDVLGRKVTAASAKVTLAQGVIRLTEALATIEGLATSATADLTLRDRYPFTAKVKSASADVVSVRSLVADVSIPYEISGKLDLAASAKGTLSPLTYDLAGTVRSDDLVVGSVRVQTLGFGWRLDPTALFLENLKAELYRGNVDGSLKYPLTPSGTGSFGVNFKEVDALALSRAIPSLPVKLDGRVTGKFTGQIPAADKNLNRQLTGNLNLEAPQLRIQGIPAERLKGAVELKSEAIGYSLKGETLGGSFDVEGSYPLKKPADPHPAPKKDADPPPGLIKLDRIDLGRLAQAMNVGTLSPLRGRLSATVRYAWDLDRGGPVGSGRVEVVGLGWGSSGTASSIESDIRVAPDRIDMADLGGSFAGGRINGRLNLNLAVPTRSVVALSLNNVRSEDLLVPLGINFIEGEMDASIELILGQQMRGHGVISSSRARLAGLSLGTLRIPYEMAFTPGAGGQIAVRQGTALAAGGRVRGTASYVWGYGNKVEASAEFVELSLRGFMEQFGSTSTYVAGRATGRLEIQGTNVKSVNDLRGTLNANLGEAQVFGIPIFRSMIPFLSPSRALAPFRKGELAARLGNGQITIDRLAMQNSGIQMWIDGQIGLNGRLDLNVVANTGQIGPNTQLLRLLGIRIPVAGPIPIGLILKVSDYLSNRLIRLHIGGTVSSPSVQVNTARILADEVIRFFVGQYVPLQGQLTPLPR